jgi:Trypsin-like peptidase domain
MKNLFLVLIMILANLAYAQDSSTNSSPNDEPTLNADTPDQQLFFCTTRIEATSADGKITSTGTGFVFDYEIDKTNHIPFIVTCRHVVDGFVSAKFSFVQNKDGKPNLGHKCEAAGFPLQHFVFYNSDPKIDVALIPLEPILHYFEETGQKPFYVNLDKGLVPDKNAAGDLSAIQSIVFIGYPYGMHDEVNLLPIARRGITASPYVVDYNGLPLFLIDANVFPGSSGSPVMVLDEGGYATKRGISLGGRTYFLGLVDQAYIHTEEGVVKFVPLPTQFVPTYDEHQYFNLGAVIKAKAILNTMSEFVKAYMPSNSLPSSSQH